MRSIVISALSTLESMRSRICKSRYGVQGSAESDLPAPLVDEPLDLPINHPSP